MFVNLARAAAALTLAALLPTCIADVQPYSNTAGVALAVQSVANGSSYNLEFQLSVPSSSWGGVAIGDAMGGALFFVLYPNTAGTGATVSARTASGNVMPRQVSGINYDVTNTTVSNGKLVANVICYSCTWPTLDFTSSQSAWLWAVGPSGSSISSNSQSQAIQQHSQRGNFNLDLAASVQRSTSNTAGSTGTSGTSGTSGTTPAVLAPTSTAGAEVVDNSSEQRYMRLIIAHAVLLPLAFLFFFPLAVLLLRFVSARLHYMATGTALLLAIAGMAIAIRFSLEGKLGFMTAHQIIGLTAVSLLPLVAAGGALNHWLYKKHGKPTPLGFVHVWAGRVAILLGMLNASLGLQLAGKIAAAAGVGAASFVIYFATFGVAIWRKHQQTSYTRRGEKGSGNSSE